MNIQEALRSAIELQAISDTPKLDVELFLMSCLACERSHLYAWPEKQLTAEQAGRFQGFFERRLAGEPVAYILQEREFWSLNLEVSPATLIPRPDTEALVERALNKLIPSTHVNPKILDLGTGTGAIALALAVEISHADVLASDFNAEAVELAERNRCRNHIDNVKVVQSDWFEQIAGRFDLIVSNPPYIAESDEHLALGDVKFEPRSALVAADDGLADIKIILSQAKGYLNHGAWVLIEHGWQQGDAVRNIMNLLGYEGVETIKDLNGQDRVTEGRYCD